MGRHGSNLGVLYSVCVAGFVIGHAGLLQGLLMLVVAYFIISLTILSICAISTNGAVQGGGAYCILSELYFLQHELLSKLLTNQNEDFNNSMTQRPITNYF